MIEDLVIQTEDLSKRFGNDKLAVDGLGLCVQRGQVFGLLGPNGAGKTTTLKMLLGLIRPTRGRARVAGFPPGHRKGLSKVGALVEVPAFYPYLSGRSNLRLVARYCGAEDSRCEAALEEVGLAGAAAVRFSAYSTGMKQRLGLAAALIKEPELLILDEPSSGLDPQGMIEMRELIRTLGAGNRSVLISSHLLTEVEQICDRVGVIHQGRLVAEGALEELRGMAGVLVTARPLERARSVVEALLGSCAVAVVDGQLRLAIDSGRIAEVVRRLVEAGVEVEETRRAARSLEEIFLSLTTSTETGRVRG